MIIIVPLVVALVVCLVLSLRLRRHGERAVAQPDWSRTDEVFRDPSTSRLMRVWTDVDGNRHYVPE